MKHTIDARRLARPSCACTQFSHTLFRLYHSHIQHQNKIFLKSFKGRIVLSRYVDYCVYNCYQC